MKDHERVRPTSTLERSFNSRFCNDSAKLSSPAFRASPVGKFASRKDFARKPSSGIWRASSAARPSVITWASLEESVAATSSSNGVPLFRSSTWSGVREADEVQP